MAQVNDIGQKDSLDQSKGLDPLDMSNYHLNKLPKHLCGVTGWIRLIRGLNP